jgi:hypothetical protein
MTTGDTTPLVYPFSRFSRSECQREDIELRFIQPGKPDQNA